MKNKSFEKLLPRLAMTMTFLFLLIIIPINMWFQLYIQHNTQKRSAEEMFGQFEQQIRLNEKELENTRKEFAERCIQAADAVAFCVMLDKNLVFNREETRELADKLEIDEIHYFSQKGEIIEGTHPKYFGFTFDSGEQMNFFKPMLEDRTMKLCQEIMPNTAEGKPMQYAAVWTEDGSYIVQIGMEPRRLQEEMEEKSLQNIIRGFPFEVSGYLHIIDKNTNTVVASTKETMVGMDFDKELRARESAYEIRTLHEMFGGKHYCVYLKEYDDYIFVRTYESLYSFYSMLKSSGLVIFYTVIGSIGIVWMIRRYVKRKLVSNLNAINRELRKIEDGNIEKITLNTGITEFEEVLFYINRMLDNIRLNWDKFSYIMDKAGIPVGIYEKNTFYKKAFVNDRLIEILDIGKEDASPEEMNSRVEEKLRQAQQKELDGFEHIFEYGGKENRKYLRIEKITDDQSVLYYVTDVSFWWEEMNHVKERSSIDELTGVYNRRGFYEKMESLFEQEDAGGCAAMLMIDADNLKKINDTFGHNAGDQYLRTIAKELQKAAGERSVCGRLGGDEFVVFLYGMEQEELKKRIAAIKAVRGQRFETELKNQEYGIQFSLGASFYPLEGEDFHLLMRIADERMYQEKNYRKSV